MMKKIETTVKTKYYVSSNAAVAAAAAAQHFCT